MKTTEEILELVKAERDRLRAALSRYTPECYTKDKLMTLLTPVSEVNNVTAFYIEIHPDDLEDLADSITHWVEFRPIDPDNPLPKEPQPLELDLDGLSVKLMRNDDALRGCPIITKEKQP